MSETYAELNQAIANLDLMAGQVTSRLNLKRGGFQWLETQRRYPMEPQPIMPGKHAVVHEWFTSDVTVYGGGHTPAPQVDPGRFAFGIVRGSIAEALPDGRTHINSQGDIAVPYIKRILTLTPAGVTVDVPFADRDEAMREGEGLIYHEGIAGYVGRTRVTTVYRRGTQELAAVVGSQQRFNEEHYLEDAQEYEVLDPHSPAAIGRLAIMQRSLEEATGILDDVQERGDFFRPPGTAYCTL